MKKMMALVLSLVMALSVMCGAAFAEGIDITGDWYAELFGMTASMNLADGTYTFDLAGDISNGTYTFDGANLCMDEGTEAEVLLPYDAERNVIIFDMGEGLTMEFGREVPEVFVPAAGRTDTTVEEFTGEWKSTMVDAMGLMLPPDFVGFDFSAKVEGTMVSMVINMAGEITELTIDGVFADGILMVTVPATETSEEMLYTMQLLEDGMMSASFGIDGEELNFYMEKVVAEEIAE